MSGHSKWSTIKRKKGALDAKRSKIFSRVVKEIHVAIKEGGSSSPDMNPRLRLAIQNAKSVNMPKDNIERAINKASSDNSNLTEVTLEGYASHGIAVIIECLTDNNLRTVSSVRAIFNKKGGSLGVNGSVNYMFGRKGVFTIQSTKMEREELELELIDAGLEEIEAEGSGYIITTAMEEFGTMQKKLDELGIEISNAVLERIPETTKVLDLDAARKVLAMIDDFEDLDDVQNVYHNLEMTDELACLLNGQ
ncbi:MAG: YebC/PmpR family DNA-binding transcriptional regulator [Bacteroidota bacterium]